MNTFISACKRYMEMDDGDRALLDRLLAGDPVAPNRSYVNVLSFLDYLVIFSHDLSIRSRMRVNALTREIELAIDEEFGDDEEE